MAQSFIAQSSIAAGLSAGFPGLIADAGPVHIVHGLNTSRQTVVVTPVAANGAVYTVVINGTSFAYTADGSATVAEITAGLTALVNAGTVPVTATDNTTTMSLVADLYGADDSFTYSVSASAGSIAASQTVSQAAALNEGYFTCFDGSISSDPIAVRVPAASGDVTGIYSAAGIVLSDNYVAGGRTSSAAKAPHMVNIMRKGRVYVPVLEAVTRQTQAYVNYATGQFTAVGGTNAAALNGAVFITSASAGNLAIVEINIVGG